MYINNIDTCRWKMTFASLHLAKYPLRSTLSITRPHRRPRRECILTQARGKAEEEDAVWTSEARQPGNHPDLHTAPSLPGVHPYVIAFTQRVLWVVMSLVVQAAWVAGLTLSGSKRSDSETNEENDRPLRLVNANESHSSQRNDLVQINKPVSLSH